MKKKTRQELLSSLSLYGYPLLQPERKPDPNELLADLTASQEPRLLEGFPVVLAHCLARKEPGLNLEEAEKLLANPKHRALFRELVSLSLALFDLYEPALSKHGVLAQRKPLKLSQSLKLGPWVFDLERLKKTFLNYVVHSRMGQERNEQEKSSLHEDFRREYLLSHLLTPRQKELLYKKLRRDPMTKTEKEYYSRVVKKKLLILADPDLHRLAQKALASS